MQYNGHCHYVYKFRLIDQEIVDILQGIAN